MTMEVLHTPRGKFRLSQYSVTPHNTHRAGTPRAATTPRRRFQEATFGELYPHFSCDALATQTLTQLLLMEKEDFEKLPGFDAQKAQNMSVYRFLLYADKDELYKGAADPKKVAVRAAQVREKSEGTFAEYLKRMKRSAPRSPKRKQKHPLKNSTPSPSPPPPKEE